MQEIDRLQADSGGSRNADMMMCEKKAELVTYLPKSKLRRRHLREKRWRARQNSSNGVGGRPRVGRDEDDGLAVASGGSSSFRGKGGVPPFLTAVSVAPHRAGARFSSRFVAPRHSILSKAECTFLPVPVHFN